MQASPPDSPSHQRLKMGGPLRVLLVVDPPALLLRMMDVVRSTDGLQLAGAFSTGAQATDWAVWDRDGYHLAFVDMGLPGSACPQVVQRLLAQPRAGTIVALGDHLWREVRAQATAMGMAHLLEKGDIVAFRGFLEAQVR